MTYIFECDIIRVDSQLINHFMHAEAEQEHWKKLGLRQQP